MQIISLRLKNIKSHQEAEFTFAPGINVLAGPNGAGKSTVFEAIGYALFGVDARDIVGRADRFLSLGASRGEVEVVFRSAAGEIWRVTRSVGGNGRWLLAQERDGNFETEEHARAEETEERLRQILGLDRSRPLAEQFHQVIGPLQSEFLGPFILRGAKRQEAFDRILGVDGWRRTFAGTLDLQKAVKNRIDCLQAEIAGRAEQLILLPAKQAELQEIARQEQARAAALGDGERELQAVEADLTAREARRLALERAEEEVRRLTERIAAGREKTALQQERVAEAESALAIVEASRAGRDACEQAETALKELRGRERERQAAEKEVQRQEREIDRLQHSLAHEEEEIAAGRQQLADEEKELADRLGGLQADPAVAMLAAAVADLRRRLDLKRGERALLQGRHDHLREGREQLADGICPFLGESCGNLAGAQAPFDERLRASEEEIGRRQGEIVALEQELATAEKAERALAALNVQRQEVLRQQAAFGERRRKLTARAAALTARQPEVESAERALAAGKAALALFAGLEAAIAAAEAECEAHRSERDRHLAHLAVATDLPARRQTLRQYEALLATLQQEQTAKSAGLQPLRAADDPQAHAQARGKRDELLARIAALRQELKGLAGERGRLAAEIALLQRVEGEVAVRRTAVERLQTQEAMVKFLRTQVFNQVSNRLSERFREEISRRADGLYRTIAAADEELVWGEGYQVILRDLQDGTVRERSDEQLSGGQTMSAVVALRLALLQTIGARLAFFDEPTSNLDAGRRENLARAFRAIDIGREEVAEHWYDQLFLISHDVSFAEITDQVIALGEKENAAG